MSSISLLEEVRVYSIKYTYLDFFTSKFTTSSGAFLTWLFLVLFQISLVPRFNINIYRKFNKNRKLIEYKDLRDWTNMHDIYNYGKLSKDQEKDLRNSLNRKNDYYTVITCPLKHK